jgi:ribosome-binding protein aMBF1 (putative translation factor)
MDAKRHNEDSLAMNTVSVLRDRLKPEKRYDIRDLSGINPDLLIGSRIRKARKKLGLPAVAVAQQLNIGKVCLLNIETGRRSLKAYEIPEFSRVLGIPPDRLMGRA